MDYQYALQADALTVVTNILRNSFGVKGELLEDGLATFKDDQILALFPKIAGGEETDAGGESVEPVFGRAWDDSVFHKRGGHRDYDRVPCPGKSRCTVSSRSGTSENG